MSAQSTINIKGQVTIPKEIRDGLGLKAHGKIYFSLLNDGTVIMRAKKNSIVSVAGMLNDSTSEKVKVYDQVI